MNKTRFKKETIKNFRITKVNKKKDKPLEKENDLIYISLINFYSTLIEIYNPLEFLYLNLCNKTEWNYYDIYNYFIFFNKSLTVFNEFLNYIKTNKYNKFEDLIKCLYIKYFKKFEDSQIIEFLKENQKGKILLNEYFTKIRIIDSTLTNFDNEDLLSNEFKVYLNSFEKIIKSRKDKLNDLNTSKNNGENNISNLMSNNNYAINEEENINSENSKLDLSKSNYIKKDKENSNIVKEKEESKIDKLKEDKNLINLFIDNFLLNDIKSTTFDIYNQKENYENYYKNIDEKFKNCSILSYEDLIKLLNKINYYKIITFKKNDNICGLLVLELIQNYIKIHNFGFTDFNDMESILINLIEYLKKNYNFNYIELSLKHSLVDNDKLKLNSELEKGLKKLKFKWSKLENFDNYERYTTFKYKNIDYYIDNLKFLSNHYFKFNENIKIIEKNKEVNENKIKEFNETILKNLKNDKLIDSNLLLQFAFIKNLEKNNNLKDIELDNSFFKKINCYEDDGFYYELNNNKIDNSNKYNFKNYISIKKTNLIQDFLKINIFENLESFLSEETKSKIHIMQTNSKEIYFFIIELCKNDINLTNKNLCLFVEEIMKEKLENINETNDENEYALLKFDSKKFNKKDEIINDDNFEINSDIDFELNFNNDFENIIKFNENELIKNSKFLIKKPFIFGTIFSKIEEEEKSGKPIYSILIKD